MFNKVCRCYFIVHTHAHQSDVIIILCPYTQRLHADLEDKEARLRAQEEEMKERDAEINRLLGELRRCQTQLLGPLVQNYNIVEPL